MDVHNLTLTEAVSMGQNRGGCCCEWHCTLIVTQARNNDDYDDERHYMHYMHYSQQ